VMHALLSFGSASDLRRLNNTDFSDTTVPCVTHPSSRQYARDAIEP